MASGYQYSTVDTGKKGIELDFCEEVLCLRWGVFEHLQLLITNLVSIMTLRIENAPPHIPNEKILRNSILRNGNR